MTALPRLTSQKTDDWSATVWVVLAVSYAVAVVALLGYLAWIHQETPSDRPHMHSGPYIPPNARSPRPKWRSIKVTAYAYNSERTQTDRNPWVTACLTRPAEGTVAVSQDLFKPTGGFLPCGALVRLGGVPYIVNDTMAPRHRRSVDVWMRSKSDARSWGVRRTTLEVRR